MFNKLVLTSTLLILATTAGAQERGTLEFGGFASAASFDSALSLKTGYGGGGRLGAYLDPRLSIEFEDAEMRATRPNGLRDVNVGILSGRLVAVPLKSGNVSLLLGGGAGVSTETNFMHTYGLDALAGVKIAMGPAAFRVDGVVDWLANQDWKTYKSVRAGISLYRNPFHRVDRVTVPGPTTVIHDDSVTAMEIYRLRARDRALDALRDSLSRTPSATPVRPMTSSTVYFGFDSDQLTTTAQAVLDSRISDFKATPDREIKVVGYTDLIGTSAYNMALGERRARSVRDYLVSHGIAATRIVVTSRGKTDPVTTTPGTEEQAANRRAIFWLLIDSK